MHDVDVAPPGGGVSVIARYPYGPQPHVKITSNLQEVREKQAEAVMRTAPEREEIWRMIEQERSSTERQMVGRYGEEFRR